MQTNLIYAGTPDLQLEGVDGKPRSLHDRCYEYQVHGAHQALLGKVRGSFAPASDLAIKHADFTPQAMFFDMDSTLIAQESLVEIARLLGKGEDVDRITEQAMAGKMDFETSLRQRLTVLQGVSVQVLEQVRSKLTLNKHVDRFIEACNRKGIKCFLISGGFTELAKPFADQLGLTDFHAHTLEKTDGKLTGRLVGSVVDARAKADWVARMLEQHRIPQAQAVAVGDGANDILMMQQVGYAVGYCAKPVTYQHLHAHLGCGDYEFLSYVLI